MLTEIYKGDKNRFSNLSQEWLELHRSNVCYGTYKMYRHITEALNLKFGNENIGELKFLELQKYINSLYSYQKFSKSRIQKYIITLNLIIKYAIKNELININIAASLQIPIDATSTIRLPISQNQIQIIHNNYSIEFGLYGFLLIYTGLRKSECLALQGEDFDFENKRIKIWKKVIFENNRPIVKEYCLKNKTNYRYVPIFDEMIDIIKQLIKPGFIFVDENNELLYDSKIIKSWKKYCEKIGLKFTQHQARHTYATILYNAGVDLKSAQYFLGHKCSKVTMDIYTHLDEENLPAQSSNMINEYVKLKLLNKNNH